jgi:hypothetical protein
MASITEESPVNEGATTATDVDQSTINAPAPGIQTFDDGSIIQTFDDGSILATDTDGKVSSSDSPQDNRRSNSNLPPGATPPNTRSIGASPSNSGATVSWAGAKDMRTQIIVPSSYLGPGPTSVLKSMGGILFPYTPSISYDNQASYNAQAAMHSNYPVYFYQKSSVGPITISGKFSNQNEDDGAIYLGIVHLLRSLTKMLWGSDPNAGSPPPVCRLNAYGDSMLANVPVSVASFKIELPDGVDYISVGTAKYKSLFGLSMVPTISTISVTLNVMYSRQEIQDFNVTGWLAGNLKGKGYL